MTKHSQIGHSQDSGNNIFAENIKNLKLWKNFELFKNFLYCCKLHSAEKT